MSASDEVTEGPEIVGEYDGRDIHCVKMNTYNYLLIMGLTSLGDKCFESFLMVSGQPENRESSKTGTDSSQALLVDKGFPFHHINSHQQILHGLAAVVFAYLIGPFLTHGKYAPPVGGNHNITVGGHLTEIPAVAPKLAQG